MFLTGAIYPEIWPSRRFSSVPRVGNAATQAGKVVISTWTKCPPKLDPEMLRFLQQQQRLITMILDYILVQLYFPPNPPFKGSDSSKIILAE